MNAPLKTPSADAFEVVNIRGGESRHDLSSQWVARPADERYLSLTALRDAKQRQFEASRAVTIESKLLSPIAYDIKERADMHRISWQVPTVDAPVASTHWAFGQAAAIAKAPAGYLRRLPAPIAADALSWGLKHGASEMVKAYVSEDEEGARMRAITGPDYGRIPDYEVVNSLVEIAGDGLGSHRWKVPGTMDWRTMIYDPRTPVSEGTTTIYGSDRDVFVFLVDDLHPIQVGVRNGEPDLMFRGFYATNSETGASALKIACFYLRALCCNRIMWGVEGFEEVVVRHSKYAPDRWLMEAKPALDAYAAGSESKLIAGVQAAQAAKIAADDKEAVAWLADRGLSRKAALAAVDAVMVEEGHPARSIWDMAQGITATARNIVHTDERVAMEAIAKRMLDKVA